MNIDPTLFGPDASPAMVERLTRIFDGVGTGSLEKFLGLSPAGRAYFLQLLERSGMDQGSLDACFAVDYERRPVDPKVFISHTDYMAHACTPTQDVPGLFPAWRPYFERVCAPLAGIFELDITGASGLGKTYFAMLVLAYKIYRLSCLRNPAAFHGLTARSKIVFGLYAFTKELVKRVGFYDLRDQLIDPSPYFRDAFPRSPHGKEIIRWPQKGIEVITGSGVLHAIAHSLYAVVADELNWFAQGEKTATDAHELVAEISRRLESRFVREGGEIPGVAIFVSQTRTTSDFLEERIRDHKARNTNGVLVIRGPRWAFNPMGYDAHDNNRGFKVGDPSFRVYVGNEVSDPRILDNVVRRQDGTYYVAPIDPDEKVPEGRIINVPVAHHRAHVDDLFGALRNIDDEPTGSFTPFFGRNEIIEQCFTTELPNPFAAQVIPVYEKSSEKLQASFDIDLVTRVYMGRRIPIRHPEAMRYIHLDLSQKGDRTGFVMVHPSGHYMNVRKAVEADDPAKVGDAEVVKDVEVDFYVAITSGPFGEPIDYKQIRIFIGYLQRIGFNIRMVTADQYMSFDMLQRIRETNVLADVQSVDKTSKPYRDLRQSMGEGRVFVPYPQGVTPKRWGSVADALRHVILFQELTGLEHDVKRDRVDHREKNPDGSVGSKDVADGLAGSVFRCLADKVALGEHPNVQTQRQKRREQLNRYIDRAGF